MGGFLIGVLPQAQAVDTVEVNVSAVTSTLGATALATQVGTGVNTPSSDYRIRGDVIISDNSIANRIYISVDTLQVSLVNVGSPVLVDITGTIGGVAVTTTPTLVTFTGTLANIDLTGDIDESTLTFTTQPGVYQGSITITATLI